MTETNTKTESLKLATQLVGSYVAHNAVPSEQLIPMLQQVYSAIVSMSEGNHYTLRTTNLKPAVSVDQSVFDDYIICLEDGKKLQMLKRHLKTVYNMSIEQYKERWFPIPTGFPLPSGLGQSGRKRKLSAVA